MVYWYGHEEAPIDCESIEDLGVLQADDIVIAPEARGILDIQRLIASVSSDVRVIIVLKNPDRMRVQQWQAVGADVVIGEALLDTCIAELIPGTAVTAETKLRPAVPDQRRVTASPRIQPPKRVAPAHSRTSMGVVRFVPAPVPPVDRSSKRGWLNFKKEPVRRTNLRTPEYRPEPVSRFTGRIISVVSAKGRMGKTAFIANAAAYLANQGARVLVVEGDPSGELNGILGHEPSVTLTDLVRTSELSSVRDYIDSNGPYNFDILFAPQDDTTLLAEPEVKWLIREIEEMRKDYAVIFLDLPPQHEQISFEFLKAADDVLYFVQPDIELFDRIGTRYRNLLSDDLYDLHPNKVHVVFSRLKRGVHTQDIQEEAARLFSTRPLGNISEANDMHKFVRLGELPIIRKPRHPYSKQVKAIIEQFLDVNARPRR